MKMIKIAGAAIVTAALLIGTPNTAMAKTHVSIGVGFGYPGFYGGYYHHYGPHWRHHPYRSGVFIGGSFWWPGYYDYYPYYPGYYVVNPPPAVVVPPPVVENQQTVAPPVVAPQGTDENTLKLYQNLREKKGELMRKLEIGDKTSQIQAIRDLAGFSFDDNVRQAIENVLLTNTDAQLRTAAAEALGSVKNTKAIAALENARINDSEVSVRQAADAAIRNIEGQ